MNDTEIKSIIEKLDSLVPKQGASVCVNQTGSNFDETTMVANSAGYLRVGIEFLKGAYGERTPSVGESKVVSLDIGQFLSERSDMAFLWSFIRDERLPELPKEEASYGWWVVAILVGISALSIMGLAIYGAIKLFG